MITEMGDWAGPSHAAPTCERVVWRYVRHSSLHDTRDAVEGEGRELQKGFALAIDIFKVWWWRKRIGAVAISGDIR